jgi:septum site-determining protein MinC
VTLLRGRRDGIEVSLSERDFEQACDELEARLAEQPSFYRGSSAVVNFGDACPSDAVLARLRGVLEEAGIALRALSGSAGGLADLARERGLDYEASPEVTSAPLVQAAAPSGPQPRLSDAARSLAADFAGARDDIAQRRRRGEASVPRLRSESRSARPPALHVVEAAPGTLYHPGTLRGGQVLHHTGNIVVVGDVNPGAELVATGDIVVFGRLRGIAHAGAGGDESARIYALDLSATQLRIATFIAAEQENKPRRTVVPEAALARDGGIVVLALDRLGEAESAGAAPA